MPGGTRRVHSPDCPLCVESPPRPDWRKRALAEGRATVFTPAELRSMGFNRNVIIVVPYERTGRKVRGYRRGRPPTSRSPTETWTVSAVEARKRRR